jgi:hypothetical protein
MKLWSVVLKVILHCFLFDNPAYLACSSTPEWVSERRCTYIYRCRSYSSHVMYEIETILSFYCWHAFIVLGNVVAGTAYPSGAPEFTRFLVGFVLLDF